MANVTDLRTGLKNRLATIAGLRTHATIPDLVNPPAVIVGPPETTFDAVFGRGCDKFEVPVRIYVGRAAERASQNRLDGYLAGSGAASIKAAIESDPTLAGAAQTLRVTEARNYGVYSIGGIDYLGAEWVVEIYA